MHHEHRRGSATAFRAIRPLAASALATTLLLFALTVSTATAQTSVRYFPDTTYNGGVFTRDGFGGSATSSYLGRKIVRMDNGDVVVAGVVPPFGGVGNLVNLGLVRYSASGQRVAWANPGAYGFVDNQYVIYPNTNATAGLNVVNVLDIKRYGNRLFVLVDRAFSASDIDSRVVVFDDEGRFLAVTSAFGGDLAEYSGGIVLYDNFSFPTVVSIAVAGTTYVNGVARPSFRRGTVNADSTISFDAVVFPNPGNYCPANRGCVLNGIAAGGRPFSTSPPRLYLAGTREQDLGTQNWDYLAMQVSSTGNPVTSFAGNGVTTVPFNRGGSGNDVATAIVASSSGLLGSGADSIYLVGRVRLACTDGVGVTKLRQDGSIDPTFGDFALPHPDTGTMTYGSLDATPPACTGAYEVRATAAALSNDGARLGVAGYRINYIACPGGPPCPEAIVEASMATMGSGSGKLTSNGSYTFTVPPSLARAGHGALWGITASEGSTFTVSGEVRALQSAPGQPAGPRQFATLRLRVDTLFQNGFDAGM